MTLRAYLLFVKHKLKFYKFINALTNIIPYSYSRVRRLKLESWIVIRKNGKKEGGREGEREREREGD